MSELPEGLRIEYTPLSELRTAKRNPKGHQLASIQTSISRFGFAEPAVVDERTGQLVAGHGRRESLLAMRNAGQKPPEGVQERGGEWLVPVVRGWKSRSDQEAEAFLLASNQLTIAGGWGDGLAEMLKELNDAKALDGVGFGDKELSRLLDSISSVPPEVDEVPPTPAEPYVKPGDMYELGPHRILCGSSTAAADVDRLLGGLQADICWTDPPWNVALGEGGTYNAKRKVRPIANDDMGADFPGFCALFAGQVSRVLKPGAPIYVAMSSSEWATIDLALKAAGFHWSASVIWAKESLVLTRRDYHSQYEPIWYGWKEGAGRLVEVEDRTQSDLWEIPRPKVSDEHPTMKPVELVARSIKNSSRRGALVFEPFSGSGTTIMAAETTGRVCRAIELEPRYVQVAIERWEKFTGQKAVKQES